MAPVIQQVPQHEAVQPQDGARRFDVSDRPLQFAVIPQVCTFAKVAELLAAVSERQLHYLLARKKLALAEVTGLDKKRRFTGESVAREIKRLSTKRVA